MRQVNLLRIFIALFQRLFLILSSHIYLCLSSYFFVWKTFRLKLCLKVFINSLRKHYFQLVHTFYQKKKEKSEAQKCCTSKHIWLPHKKTSYHLKSILINTRISSTPLTPKQEDENFHLEIIHSVNFN